MQVDYFKDIIVPVIGGLGIFMLGLEFMSNGIQSLAVSKMRSLLAKVAGTPITGLAAGTFITGIIQSSTAMTVMVVGLVNAGVLGLRPAISVIMGANIGTTIGNGLIALPLGPLGLVLGGFFALIYVFAKNEQVRNIALACMGFALIFYGLNLMTGGLRPLRGMPEVMSVISSLKADNYLGLIYCVLIAAFMTALIHSSSATIGIVMGLGAAGVLDWQTAVAFSLGADLGTTITSWMASLNLSRNAKRAAYAHIIVQPDRRRGDAAAVLLSMKLLVCVMGWFGGDPGVAVMVNGKETFPLVPVAVGLYSTAFNIFNTALMFPFIGVFDRVLSQIGHHTSEDTEDYSQARYLDSEPAEGPAQGRVGDPAGDRALSRSRRACSSPLRAACRRRRTMPRSTSPRSTCSAATSANTPRICSIRTCPIAQADLVASLIEEEDWTASLGETLYQVARRVERQNFTKPGRELVDATLDQIAEAMRAITPATQDMPPVSAEAEPRLPALLALRAALPEAARPVLGRTRCDPDAARQRRTCLLPDRAHRRRTPFGLALTCRRQLPPSARAMRTCLAPCRCRPKTPAFRSPGRPSWTAGRPIAVRVS